MSSSHQFQLSELVSLKSDLQDRATEIELLQKTFTEIGSELDLQKIYQLVAERARELIHAETLLIPILDENLETYTYQGGAGKNAGEIVGESLPLDFGICGWVWRHKRPWWRGILDELSEDERNLWEKEAATVIMVPLQGKRHFLGGISGINKLEGRDFNRRDLNLLSMFASIVAISIENAMAYQKIEDANQLMADYQISLERLNRQLSESNHELEFLSLYDPVTTLPNRSLFRDRISQHVSLAKAHNHTISLVLIDLDNFKSINETLGHEQGDQLLKLIAQRFMQQLNPDETLCRLGGDEFVLIFPALNEDEALQRANYFQELLNNPFNIASTEIVVGASMGISIYPKHGEDISTLLRHSDHAMYTAKQQKRGVAIYDPDEDTSSLGQLTMTVDLRKAFEENQFELHYQPKIDISSSQLVGVEALARWKHPDRGHIPPAIFISVLEQNGLIDRFTYWAIETALKQINTWKQQGHRIKIAVNISTQSLINPEFIKRIESLIADETTGSQLLFEITENLFLSEYDRLSDILGRLKKLGITLSIDDFGTGYSSLSRLRKLPVSELKIDRSFVIDMVRNPDDEVIVRSTIDLAHNLGLVVIAEGVENATVLERLGEMGCDIAQGYHISRPVPANQLLAFLKKD